MNYLELYYFMRNHECGIMYNNDTKQIEAWVHVSYAELDEFLKIVHPEYENYPTAQLHENSVCVFMQEVLEDGDFPLNDFKKCFDISSWREAHILELYGDGNAKNVCAHCANWLDNNLCKVESSCEKDNMFRHFQFKER